MSDNVTHDGPIEVLHRMLDDATSLTRLGDPVLVPRSRFLVAFLTDTLALEEPAAGLADA